jgi:LacI family transcriptional regulator
LQRRATSLDVARLANVSRSAVSLVLNGRGDGMVSASSQAAILEAARHLGYTPNATARSLRSQRTHTVGVVTDAIASGAYGGRLLSGAARVAQEAGFLLLVMDTAMSEDRETEAFETLRSRQVEGLMFGSMETRPYIAPTVMQQGPSVLANCFEPHNAVTSIGCDELAGGRSAAQVLLDHGHRDITMLTGATNVVATGRRVAGYEAALTDAGLGVRETVTAGWQIEDGFTAGVHVLSTSHRPTGIICANDRVAVGVALAAGRLGLSIPGDLSLVGYDDDEHVAQFMVPPLTTVALPYEAMGEEAMRHLVSRIAEGTGGEPEQVMLPCPLVIRESVAAPSR